jgi:C1A family cysteine protease
MPRKVQRYGWVPDLPDPRDLMYAAPLETLQALPIKIDLRNQCPRISDQGNLGSCTANAIAGAFQFEQKKQSVKDFAPARLFIYYNERKMEGTINQDSGARIRDGIKSVAQVGVCPETDWPYDITKFVGPPPSSCFQDAAKSKLVTYHRVAQSLSQVRACLASGYPFVFGFTVYESFESAQVAKTGEVPMPSSSEQQVGGHAVMAVGYDDAPQRFIVRNSWGSSWGINGYCTMPYAYLSDHQYSSDFWTIRGVTGQTAKLKAAAAHA